MPPPVSDATVWKADHPPTMTIKLRLLALLAVMGPFLLACAAMGNLALHSESPELQDRLRRPRCRGLRQFSIIRDAWR